MRCVGGGKGEERKDGQDVGGKGKRATPVFTLRQQANVPPVNTFAHWPFV